MPQDEVVFDAIDLIPFAVNNAPRHLILGRIHRGKLPDRALIIDHNPNSGPYPRPYTLDRPIEPPSE